MGHKINIVRVTYNPTLVNITRGIKPTFKNLPPKCGYFRILWPHFEVPDHTYVITNENASYEISFKSNEI